MTEIVYVASQALNKGMESPAYDYARIQHNWIEFLRLEIDLARTFYTMSETTRSSERCLRLLRLASEAINTVERFEHWIEDAAVRKELTLEVAKLVAILGAEAHTAIQVRGSRQVLG